jgi:thiamine biosynthesis lipoprotein
MKGYPLVKIPKRVFLLCAALQICLLTACGGTPELYSESSDLYLGTVVTLSAYNRSDEIFSSFFTAIADIDRRMSVNSPESEISRVNQGGAVGAKISADSYALLALSSDISRASDGAFDVSIGAVSALWKDEFGAFGKLPDDGILREKLRSVNYRDIAFLDENTVRLNRQGAMLDLGAIAKGYACDRAVEALEAKKVKSALVDLGGNIYAHGLKIDGSKWTIGIKSPIVGENGIVCALELSDRAVVTSGGYERYFEKDGIIYCHILNPKTGYPAENDLLSVTVVGTSSAICDALSTACFVLGFSEGLKLLAEYAGYEGIFITDRHVVYATDGLDEALLPMDDRFAFRTAASGFAL